MSLVSSRTLVCPVCGTAGKSCGPSHGSGVVDLPSEGTVPKPATHLAEARINNQTVNVRTTIEHAKARGWTIIGPLGPNPFHKARTVAPAPVTIDPETGDASDPIDLAAMSRSELYTIAQTLDLPGRSSMSRDELAAAIAAAGGPQ